MTAVSTPGGEPYLVVDDLTVKFPTADGLVQAVTGLSYSVELGKTLAVRILGELTGGRALAHDPSTAGLIARLKAQLKA